MAKVSCHCVTDLSPRWIVLFKKEGMDSFTLRFNQLDDMIIAVARAQSIGYTVKTLPAKPRTHSM